MNLGLNVRVSDPGAPGKMNRLKLRFFGKECMNWGGGGLPKGLRHLKIFKI